MMKRTTSTIQKDFAKGLKRSAKNGVPKIPKGVKKSTKNDVPEKVVPKDAKNANEDENSNGEDVKSTIQKCAVKKVIPKDAKNSNGENKSKRDWQPIMSHRTGAAWIKKGLGIKFAKGGNDRQERMRKRRQNKILITMLKVSSMLESAMEEVSKLDKKPYKR